LLLLLAGGLWFFLGGEDPSEPAAEPSEEPAEVPVREPVGVELEIPDEDVTEPSEARREAPASERPSRPAATANPEDWVCNGTIDARRVQSVVRGAPSKQVQTCYERGLKGNNLLQGQMQVELTIGTSGQVSAVFVSGTLEDRQVYSCVKRVAKTWQFPRPTGGCVRINVPFQMTPKL
jgi:outer membrane biosynthesis protein TonB